MVKKGNLDIRAVVIIPCPDCGKHLDMSLYSIFEKKEKTYYCEDCEKVCREHDEHFECKDCADACAALVKAIKKSLA